jgi:hypothetical protein
MTGAVRGSLDEIVTDPLEVGRMPSTTVVMYVPSTGISNLANGAPAGA